MRVSGATQVVKPQLIEHYEQNIFSLDHVHYRL